MSNIPAKDSKFCPECGISLEGIDPAAHALTHWVEYLDPMKSSKEARKRQAETVNGGVSYSVYLKNKEG